MISGLRKPIIKSLRLTRAELNDIGRSVVRYFQDEIIEMNQERLFTGRYVEGHRIEPEYTQLTEEEKRKKGQPFDRVTLKDTGDYYESFYVQASASQFYTGARDEKSESLSEKYEDADSSLLGLSEAQKDRFREMAMELFARRYFEKIR